MNSFSARVLECRTKRDIYDHFFKDNAISSHILDTILKNVRRVNRKHILPLYLFKVVHTFVEDIFPYLDDYPDYKLAVIKFPLYILRVDECLRQQKDRLVSSSEEILDEISVEMIETMVGGLALLSKIYTEQESEDFLRWDTQSFIWNK